MSRRPPRGGRPHPGRAARRDGARPVQPGQPGAAGAREGHDAGDAWHEPIAATRATVPPADPAAPLEAVAAAGATEATAAPTPAAPGRDPGRGGRDARSGGGNEAAAGDGPRTGCTTAQLRRFIKSRAWIPMHELRRRFAIAGHDDEVVAVDLADRRVYVGLPPREGAQLGELLRSGEVGFELATDPATPIVVGVYPMRPVVRT